MYQELRSRISALEETASELTQLRSKCYVVVHELQQALSEPHNSSCTTVAPGSEEPVQPEQLPELAREMLSLFKVRGWTSSER